MADPLALPGDDVVQHADPVIERHLHLPGTPEDVWPWLEQLGKNRGGWYMPWSVERFVPRARRALRYVDERLLGLEVGDVIDDWGPDDPSFELLSIERPHHLVWWSERPRRQRRRGPERPPMRMTWAIVLFPEGTARTHVHLRLRLDLGKPAGPVATYGGDALDWLTVSLLGKGLDERLGKSSRR